MREMSKTDKRDFEDRYSACFVDFGLKTGKLIHDYYLAVQKAAFSLHPKVFLGFFGVDHLESNHLLMTLVRFLRHHSLLSIYLSKSFAQRPIFRDPRLSTC